MTEPGLLSGGWAPDVSLAGPEWAAASPDQRQAALTVAADVVWALSGRRFGVARLLLAPWVGAAGPWTSLANTPQLSGLVGRSHLMDRPVPFGAADRARRVMLPGPVARLLTVTLDGVVLVAGTDYRLEPVTGRLARVGGYWPTQDLDAPVFTVEYLRGVEVPVSANLAAGAYAVEWVKAQTGNGACKLPARTREVARAGVTTSLVAPEQLSQAGLTGVPAVDAFISAVNPARVLANGRAYRRSETPSAVWSPELAAHRILEVGAP